MIVSADFSPSRPSFRTAGAADWAKMASEIGLGVDIASPALTLCLSIRH